MSEWNSKQWYEQHNRRTGRQCRYIHLPFHGAEINTPAMRLVDGGIVVTCPLCNGDAPETKGEAHENFRCVQCASRVEVWGAGWYIKAPFYYFELWPEDRAERYWEWYTASREQWHRDFDKINGIER